MTSRISYYKIALDDFRRRIWMLALSFLGNILALPVTFLIANRSYLENLTHIGTSSSVTERLLTYYNRFLTNNACVFMAVVSMTGALIVGLCGFRHLYSRKMTDLYHSVPIKRGQMFLLLYLNGVLIYLIPMLVSVGITAIFLFANLASHNALSVCGILLWNLLRVAFLQFFLFLILYHLCLVCVMLSGNAFNALCLTALLGSAAAGLYGLFALLSDEFLDTFHSMSVTLDQIAWASPLVSPFLLLIDFADNGVGALFTGITLSTFEHPYLLRLGTLAMTLLTLFFSYKLYQKRPSETAEHGVDHVLAQHLVRILSAALAGLFGSYLFLAIIGKDAVGWQLFGLILCGTLAFGIMDIVMHLNFHCFFAHKKEMVLTLAASCVLVLVLAFDLTGFDYRLPNKNHMENYRIQLSQYYDDSRGISITEDGLYAGYQYDPYISYADADALYPLLEQLSQKYQGRIASTVARLNVISDVKVGPFQFSFRRRYAISPEDLEALRPLVESREYLEASYPASLGLLPQPASLTVSSNLIHSQETLVDAELIAQILSAYTVDFEQHTALETLQNGLVIGSIELLYPWADQEYSQYYHTILPIYNHFGNTLALVEQEYPHLPLTKEALEIVSLEIPMEELPSFGVALIDSDGKTILSKETDTTGQTMVNATYPVPATAEYDYNWNYQIEDPVEIQALLPYLSLGDLEYGCFNELSAYRYLGRAITAKGHSISCYVLKADLPLSLPASIEEKLEQEEKTTP